MRRQVLQKMLVRWAGCGVVEEGLQGHQNSEATHQEEQGPPPTTITSVPTLRATAFHPL
eukprot:m.84409 g.84409  ORF g.84409 m.84409 type:complete len:59 (-) comp8344_c0_seq5:684-860(-)